MNFHDSKLEKNKFILYLVLFGLLSAIIFPPVNFGSISLYFVTILSPIIFLIAGPYIFRRNNGRGLSLNYAALYPFFLGVMVIISSLWSWALGFSLTNISDFLEAIKYLQFFPYFMALQFFNKSTVLSTMHNSLVCSGIIFLIVGFLQYFKPFNIFQYISILYLGTDSVHLPSVISGHRITITGSDPNIGGVIGYFFATYFIVYYLKYRNFLYLFLFLLCIFLSFMTQTRTGLISFFVAFTFYITFISDIKFTFKIFVISTLCFIIFYIIFFMDLEYITLGYEYALKGENNSLNTRFENTSLAFEHFHKSPLFGIGPSKSEYSTIIDSEYALIIQRYGLVGISIFLLYFLYLFKLSKDCLHSHWGASLLIFMIISIIVMSTNNVFSGYQVMAIIIYLNIACIFTRKSISKD